MYCSCYMRFVYQKQGKVKKAILDDGFLKRALVLILEMLVFTAPVDQRYKVKLCISDAQIFFSVYFCLISSFKYIL